MPPKSHRHSPAKLSCSRAGCEASGESSAHVTAIDWHATTASSHDPLMPCSSGGLSSRVANVASTP
jgi:hypothetical protein